MNVAKRKKKREVNQNDTFALLELRIGIIQHTQALRAVVTLLGEDKKEAAVARLDAATTALGALVRGQCAGQTMKCPHCGEEQNVVRWVDDGMCGDCGGILVVPGDDDNDDAK